MRWLSSPRRRWMVLAAAWCALLVLGWWGFVLQAEEADLDRTFLDTVYLTLQLATLDYEGGSAALNWQLQIARFVAPVMAAGTILQSASVVFREQFTRWQLKALRDHVVVVGLGGGGGRLASALAERGATVAGVDADPTGGGVSTARAHDIGVLIGDATDAEVLHDLRVERAARVIVMGGTDATNVAVASAVRQVERHPGLPPLRMSVQLSDAELCELLRGADLGGGSVRVDVFTLHERAARTWLADHPPFGDGSRPPHLMVLGLGKLGRSLVVAAAQRWREQGEGPLAITLVDPEATGRWHLLRLQHPALPDACTVRCVDIDLDSPNAEGFEAFTATLRDDPPTAVAVAHVDETLALASALLVHRALADSTVDVVVRTNADTGLGELVAGPGGEGELFPGLALFPFQDRACTPEAIDGGAREQLARSLHEDHIGRVGGGDGLRRRWEELSDAEQESSRAQADAVLAELAGLGYELTPLRRWGDVSSAFDEAEVDGLARREHERWAAERHAAGWTYGEVRDDERKHNPLLVSWDELSEDAREQNRAGIRSMPAMLARAGFEPVRR